MYLLRVQARCSTGLSLLSHAPRSSGSTSGFARSGLASAQHHVPHVPTTVSGIKTTLYASGILVTTGGHTQTNAGMQPTQEASSVCTQWLVCELHTAVQYARLGPCSSRRGASMTKAGDVHFALGSLVRLAMFDKCPQLPPAMPRSLRDQSAHTCHCVEQLIINRIGRAGLQQLHLQQCPRWSLLSACHHSDTPHDCNMRNMS